MRGTILSALRGRGDLLALFECRGFPIELKGVLELIAACARNDAATVRSIAKREPQDVHEVLANGGRLLAEFAGTWNTDGVRLLLDLGVPVAATACPFRADMRKWTTSSVTEWTYLSVHVCGMSSAFVVRSGQASSVANAITES